MNFIFSHSNLIIIKVLKFCLLFPAFCFSQIQGIVQSDGSPIEGVEVLLVETGQSMITDHKGVFKFSLNGTEQVQILFNKVGYLSQTLNLKKGERKKNWIINLMIDQALNEVVITGKLRAIKRSESILPVEVFSAGFLKQNPSPSIFESLQLVNGVRPQINCSVCNTGDIHINGLEGGYTFILIDGLPIVSSLASVYGLNGIPNAMIEQIEIAKGPAGTIYGSQAMGGLINIITKHPEYSPKLFLDWFTTSWLESNLDLGFTSKLGNKINLLSSVNAFWFDQTFDFNEDNFTDMTLQKRVSLFEKLQWKNKLDQSANLVLRYVYEDRWGGELDWNPTFRGGDDVYGESIYTNRMEILGNQPIKKLNLQYSLVYHHQDAAYGDLPYVGQEWIGFTQLTREHKTKRNLLTGGLSFRYTWYDDNTLATTKELANYPDLSWLPGVFLENEFKINEKQKILGGLRLDWHNIHGFIFTPRIGTKLSLGDFGKLRFIYGKGFRVINIFTEDHAAVLGVRELVIEDQLQPETSHNATLNYNHMQTLTNGWHFLFDSAIWYTRFNNQILPDYDTNPNEIRYANLNGRSVSQGVNFNVQLFNEAMDFRVGMTFLDNYIKEDNKRERPILTEGWSGTWSAKFRLQKQQITFDYTGSIYGPIRLPLLGPGDPRPAYSPVWSLQNIKASYLLSSKVELYLGVKNLLNWTPAKNIPFLIARSYDPFDKQVTFNEEGIPVGSPENPNALSFDPTYIYAPNQGIRFFSGIRYTLF